LLRELAGRQARPTGHASVIPSTRSAWPPGRPCFAPRLGDYLARLAQQSLAALLDRPAGLARALRQASTLLTLDVECLDVPTAWILHSAGWPATEGEQGMVLGSAPSELRGAVEIASHGPIRAVVEAVRAVRAMSTPVGPATLVALPSPAALAEAAGPGRSDWSRTVLQALVRSLGELDCLAGILFDGDDGVPALGRLLDHYRLAAICVRRHGDTRAAPPGASVARALPLATLVSASEVDLAGALLVTTDGGVAPSVAPEDLVRAAKTVRATSSSTPPASS
jgi:hypothetical protein